MVESMPFASSTTENPTVPQSTIFFAVVTLSGSPREVRNITPASTNTSTAMGIAKYKRKLNTQERRDRKSEKFPGLSDVKLIPLDPGFGGGGHCDGGQSPVGYFVPGFVGS